MPMRRQRNVSPNYSSTQPSSDRYFIINQSSRDFLHQLESAVTVSSKASYPHAHFLYICKGQSLITDIDSLWVLYEDSQTPHS